MSVEHRVKGTTAEQPWAVTAAALPHGHQEVRLMPKDLPRPEDQPLAPDTPIEVEPGVFKPLGECTKEEMLRAALLYIARIEGEMEQEIDRLTAGEDE